MEDDIFEWEQRSEETSFKHHVVAGCFAGVIEHVSLLPFENIKTNSQILKSSTKSYWRIAMELYKNGGLLQFWKGASTMASGCIPAHGAYFSIYEYSKVKMGIQDNKHYPFLFPLTGAMATIFHDMIITPFDVVKQRGQVMVNKSNIQIFKSMYKSEGILSFYRSLPMAMGINIAYSSLLVGFNETFKVLMRRKEEHTFFSYFICAFSAASVASSLTIPLDNIKTRLQTQTCFFEDCLFKEECSVYRTNALLNSDEKCNNEKCNKEPAQKQTKPKHLNDSFMKSFTSSKNNPSNCTIIEPPKVKYLNAKNAAKTIYREEGLRGFSKGVVPRVLAQAPSSAISWASYEMIKRFLLKYKILEH